MARVISIGDPERSSQLYPAFRPPSDARRPWHPDGRWYEPGEWRCCHSCRTYFDPATEQSCSANHCGECFPPLNGEAA
jgi:hypothetical protein